jgi:trimeric autotransporter adhesin
MKKLLLLCFALIVVQMTFGQLTGTKTIPGDYATIEAAIVALNAQGVGAGGVTFNVAAGSAETFSAVTAGLITTTTSSSANPIVFQKSGAGSNPIVTAPLNGLGTADYIFCISGTDYITFDGINVQENAANTTTTTQAEWGYAILKASATDGSQNVSIKNCSISLNKTNTATYGIYSNNVTIAAPTTQLTVTAVTGQNSNNKFYGNAFSNTYGGIYIYGYADGVSPYTYYDQGNDIGSVTGNTFTDFGGGAPTCYQVYMAYQNGFKIANCNINGGAGNTGSTYGIYGATAYNANGSIYSNTVQISNTATTGYIYGIYNAGLGTSGTSNTLNIYGNTIQNCTQPTSTTSYFYGIYNAASAFTINLYNNTVSNNVFGGSYYMYFMYTTSATGGTANVYNNTISNNSRSGAGTQSGTSVFYCLYVVGSAATYIHDNNIFGNSIGPVGPTYGGGMYSIYASNSSPNQNIYNNSIHDQTITSTYTSSHYLYGIYSYPASTSSGSVYNNSVYNISINLNSTGYGYIYGLYSYYESSIYGNNVYNINVTNASSGYGYGYGFYIPGSTSSVNIYKNKMYGASMAGTSGYFYGMYVASGVTMNLYNNYISDLKAPASTSTNALNGIYISSATNANLYYNTVYLNATSSSTGSFTTNGIYASTTPTVELRNNLVINKCTAPGSTTYIAAAYRRSSTTLTTYAATSNNNDFFAGTPSANNIIYHDGTNADQTMAAFKSRVSPRDGASVTENPPFVNTTTPPYDLHIQAGIATQCESGGSTVSAPNITVDYDADARYPNAGYPDNVSSPASAPDIGADEFAGILLDITSPSIAFTPFANTAGFGARLLTTTITDASGVPTTGIGLPVLYWKINSGSYSPVTATYVSGSTYTFSFGAGVVLGDVVSYYIVAQDVVSPTPNVGANPSGGASGYTVNPPACSTPPTTPYSYTIVSSMSGSFTVGSGGNYPSLTGAGGLFADINSKAIIGNVTAQIVSDLTEDGSNALNQMAVEPTGSNFTLTIQPNSATLRTISGSYAGGLIRLNGADRIIFDGRYGGSGNYLSFLNNVASGTTAVLQLISLGANAGATYNTIRNCNIKNGYITSGAYGIVAGGATVASTGADNDFNTFQENVISKAYVGIWAQGSATSNPGLMDNLQIIGNSVGSTTSTEYIGHDGIMLASGSGCTISQNTVYNIITTSTTPCGITLSTGMISSVINGNNINNITYTSTGGYGGRGMYINTGNAASNLTFSNNLVYVIGGDGYSSFSNSSPVGMYFDGTTGGLNIYHNSVYMSGFCTYSSTTLTTAILFYATTITNINLRDNIFENTMDNVALTTDKNYAIYSTAPASSFTDINYNDYYVTGAQGILGYMGADQLTLAAWRTATGKDVNSINTDPVFVSTTDLHPTNVAIDNLGVYVTAVPTDYSGVYRTNPPDMGAYEFGTNPIINTLAATGIDCSGGTLNGTINANGLTVNSFFDYGATTAYGSSTAAVPATVTGTTTTPISAFISVPPSTTMHFRARGVTGSGLIAYGPDMTLTTTATGAPIAVTLPASTITDNSAVVNGTVNALCNSTTVTFEYGLNTSYGSTVTADQSPVTGSSVVPVTALITGLTLNTTYHYRVVATSSQGTTFGADLTLTTGANPPIVTTNPATNIGNFNARINGTVVASNQTTTVTFQWGLTAGYGNTVNAIPGTVTGNTPTAVYADLSGLNYNTTYHYRVVGQNSAGTTYGSDQTFTTLCPIPDAAGTITGPTSLCQATSGHVYTVPAINYAYNGYVWTVPPGGTITGGAGTNSITVSYSSSATSGNVTVYGTSVCGNGTPSSLAVTVNPLPVPVVIGPSTACITHTYIYSTADGMSGYVWTVSTGGQIMSGAGTDSLTVKWNSSGAQFVTVTYTSEFGCPAAAPTTYNVTVGNLTTPTIAGSNLLCLNEGLHVYTTETGYNSYVWTVSAGGTIVTGQGTYQIEVNWTTPGNKTVTVNYANSYGCSANTPTSFAVTVMAFPGTPGEISGTSEVCAQTHGVSYSVAPVPNAVTYVWSVPYGVTIVSGETTNSIVVDFALDAISGDFIVKGENVCGEGPSSPPYEVTVNPIPETPVVTVAGDYLLHSSAPAGNQWYFEGTEIPGAIEQDYQATEEGFYWTIVTLNGCTSDESNHEQVIFTGINNPDAGNFIIYPIPNDGKFNVTIVVQGEETFSVNVYNNLGVNVYEKKDLIVSGKAQETINLINPSKGIYTVVFKGDKETVIRKVVVTK